MVNLRGSVSWRNLVTDPVTQRGSRSSSFTARGSSSKQRLRNRSRDSIPYRFNVASRRLLGEHPNQVAKAIDLEVVTSSSFRNATGAIRSLSFCERRCRRPVRDSARIFEKVKLKSLDDRINVSAL